VPKPRACRALRNLNVPGPVPDGVAECAAMSGAKRLAAIVVVIVIAVGVIVLGLNFSGGGVGADPSQTPSLSSVPAPSPSGAPSPEPSPDDDILATLAEIEEQVTAIRGLPPVDLEPELLNRDELRAELLQMFDEEYPPEEVAEDNATLRALGLLEPDQDIAELQLQLLGDQVLGFYDDVDKRMVIVTEEGLNALAKFTYAHEYTHALQDAEFGLASLGIDEEGQDDRALARLALVEGDASVTMLAWAIAHLSPEELLEIQSTPQPDTSGIPSWLVEQTVAFPYVDGLGWATALAGDLFNPQYREIDAAFGDPPDSTEQIVDIEKWEPRERPIPVEVPDLTVTFGDGWTEVEDTTIGQAFGRMMLEYHGIESDEARAATAGWGGDRATVVTGPDDAFAVAWRMAWDTPDDADEFVDAYNTAITELDFPASVTLLDGDEVLVAHGSSQEILRRTVDAAND
jgi:hypothetical protein